MHKTKCVYVCYDDQGPDHNPWVFMFTMVGTTYSNTVSYVLKWPALSSFLVGLSTGLFCYKYRKMYAANPSDLALWHFSEIHTFLRKERICLSFLFP